VSRRPCPWNLAELLPHAPPMILLDEALSFDESSLVAAVTIRPDQPFFAGDGVPSHVGIEFMAQACGAWAGATGREQGETVRPGMLLGTRRYEATVDSFNRGDRLIVTIVLNFRDSELGVFDCTIERGAETLAKAQLTVYQPADVQGVMAEMGSSKHG
jgi:predicted hotdog family 3-hydroxylacyl-ACP dehydratase